MTGLAFLGFLLVAALLYWRCRSAVASVSGQSISRVPTHAGVIDIATAAGMATQPNRQVEPLNSSLAAILNEKSAAVQKYDKILREIGSDATLRHMLERLRAEDSRQVEQLQLALQQLQKPTADAPKAA